MIVLNSPAGQVDIDAPARSSQHRWPAVAMLAFASLSTACSGSSRDELDRGRNAATPASVEQRRGVVQKQATPNTPQRAPNQESTAVEATGEVPQQLLALFRDDLARRALVKPETITVVSATEQQWPDGSLGCPQPGQMYTQMIVPGYRVVLGAGGERYAYHSDRSGHFIVCANGLALRPVKEQVKSSPAE